MSISKPRFLYLEDDAASQKVMKILLQNLLGYEELSIFENSANLDERLAGLASPANVVFLDIEMQPLDGNAVCQLLRQNPDYQNACIIAVSANASNQAIKRMQAVGFDGLILKPLSQLSFERQLMRIMAGEALWDNENA